MAVTQGIEQGHQEAIADDRWRGRILPPALDLSALFASLRRRAAWIVATMLVTAALALAWAMLTPPNYVSGVRILVDPRGLQVVDREVMPGAQAADANVAVVESQMRVMTSDRVLMQVIERENLATDPEFGARRGRLASLLALIGIDRAAGSTQPPEISALNALWSAVDIRRTPDSYILDLTVTTRDPQKSARIAAAIAEVYVDSEVEERSDTARRTSTALIGRLGELQQRVREAEDRVEAFRSSNRIVGSPDRLISDHQLERLSDELTAAQAELARAEEKREQMRSLIRSGAGIDTVAEALQSSTVARLREAHAELRATEQALSRQYLAQHPRLATVRDQMASLDAQINTELARIAESAEQEHARLLAYVERLSAELELYKDTNLDAKQAMVALRELERDAEANRSVYEAYMVRAREISEQEGINTTSARIISPALAPSEPRGLKLHVVLVLALGAGAGLGCVLALARDTMDQTLYSASDIAHAAGLPLLARIELPGQGGRVPFTRISGTGVEGRGVEPFVAAAPASDPAMAIRHAWNRIASAPVSQSGCRTLLVSATRKGEGKSAVALNLALAAAIAGNRVMLVDADLKSRAVTRSLSADDECGLLAVLRGEVSLREALLRNRGARMSLLPMEDQKDGAAVLTGSAFKRRLMGATSDFDVVVVDAGILAEDIPTQEVAAIVDDLVLVCREGSTARRDLEQAAAGLAGARASLHGLLVTA